MISADSAERTFSASGADCAFTRRGPVISESSASAAGSQTRVAQFDTTGRQIWSKTLDTSGTLSASDRSDFVGLVGGGVMHILDRAGDSVLTEQNTDGAMVTATRVVILSADGTVRWRDL